jgi:hypothetical protein
MVSDRAFTWSERCFRALLSLYPAEFRVRFGKEMAQIFLDCCRDKAGAAGLPGLVRLWLATLRDLGFSIPRERVRVLLNADEFLSSTAGLIDSIVIWAIIGCHLLLGGTGVAAYIRPADETPGGFLILAAMAGTALGGVGVVCSRILARFRRIQYRFIELQ